jgi:hypothetical protein
MIKFVVVLIVITFILFFGCNSTAEPQSPEPAPLTTVTSAPETATVITPPPSVQAPDTPKIPKEELLPLLWDKLPDDLPQGYHKTSLQPETADAMYQGDGKWDYSISGNVSRSSTLPQKYVEQSPDEWVEEHSVKVVTDDLLLQAEYFESTDALNILSVDKTGETETTKIISDVPVIAYKLKVNWIAGSTTGYGYRVEGSVKNIGILPLENVLFVVNGYDGQGVFMGTENITLSPAILAVGDSCKFVLDATGFYLHGSAPNKGKVTMGYYDYRFLLPSGKRIEIEEPD